MGITYISAAEIDLWTDKDPRRAQELLPKLLWKLILATCTTINDHHFPFEKAIQYSGFDGYLNIDDQQGTSTRSAFIPQGISVWEMGTDKNILKKFNDDFDKRTSSPGTVVPESTSFCFATTRIWNSRQGIAEITRKSETETNWRSVRIIDANSLEMWLAECPSVAAWFAETIGKSISGIQTIEGYWTNAIINTSPNLTPSFFTKGRKSILERIISLSLSGTKQFVLVDRCVHEAILTITAELYASKELSSYAERCVIVDSFDSLAELNANISNAIIIPTFTPTQSIPGPRENIFIFPTSQHAPLDQIFKNEHRIEIEQRTRQEYIQALKELGYSDNQSYTIANDTKCNFKALFRLITTDANLKFPLWSTHEDSAKLIPAMFTGAWEGHYSGDRQIIEALSECSYDEYIRSINNYIIGQDTPIFSIEESFACISIEEIWDCLWGKITKPDFDRFKEIFKKVFNTCDPVYELPEKQWPFANILGKESEYSPQMRHALITSIILLIQKGATTSTLHLGVNVVSDCKYLISNIFDSIDTIQQWRSICPYIPDFIEAAPEVLLEKLEKTSQKTDSPFWNLFIPAESHLFGREFYTHILWALEKLVWDEQHATRAINLLVLFSSKNLTYKISNSPENTLIHIFCPWYPQCALAYSDRMAVIKNILETNHTAGRKLVASLLNTSRTTVSEINHPKWSSINRTNSHITHKEYSDSIEFISHEWIAQTLPCYEDWEIIFNNFSCYKDLEDETIEKCKSQSSNMDEQCILNICAKLSKIISRNRKYAEADWRMPEKTIAKIEELYFFLFPDSPDSYIHYFDYHFEGLNPIPYNQSNYNFDLEEKQLAQFQEDKICEMLSKYSVQSVFSIADKIENVSAYADAITTVIFKNTFNNEYLRSLRQIKDEVAAEIIRILYHKNDVSIFSNISNLCLEEDLVWIIGQLPLSKETVSFIKEYSSDCKNAFWEHVRPWRLDLSDTNFSMLCIQEILDRQRPYTLIDFLAYSDFYDKKMIIKILQVALKQYPNAEPLGKTIESVPHYDFEHMFKKLYEDGSINEEEELEIAKLEIGFLRVFDHDFEPKFLVNQVLKHPELYIELLTMAYKSNDANDTPQKSNYAEQANYALERIRRLPGSTSTNPHPIEEDFVKWTSQATELAKNRNYTLAHEVALGKILSFSPESPDGVWPELCVRKFLENNFSSELINSLVASLRNQRGVYAITGGKEEAKIADKYYKYATNLQILYPKTASIVRRIGDCYIAESKKDRANELKGFY